MAAVFRQIRMSGLEPGRLGAEFVALAQGRIDRHGETVVEHARDLALEPAEMVDIGDHPFARLARTGATKAMPPGDMLTTWQGNSCWSACM